MPSAFKLITNSFCLGECSNLYFKRQQDTNRKCNWPLLWKLLSEILSFMIFQKPEVYGLLFINLQDLSQVTWLLNWSCSRLSCHCLLSLPVAWFIMASDSLFCDIFLSETTLFFYSTLYNLCSSCSPTQRNLPSFHCQLKCYTVWLMPSCTLKFHLNTYMEIYHSTLCISHNFTFRIIFRLLILFTFCLHCFELIY